MDLVRHFEKQQMKDIDRPHVRPGDVVRVEMKVQEGDKSRLQTFEGTVLGLRGSGPSATLTVRRETGNFGVERIFPLYSPLISSIDIVKRQKVRRSKLNYLRQAGRRRFKEDVESMQRHVKTEDDKKRLAEVALKKKQDEEEAKKKAEEKAQKEAVAEASAEKSQAESGEADSGRADETSPAASEKAETSDPPVADEKKDE